MKANNTKTSNMKSYKLNKTFENSIFPIEQELKAINKNTLTSTLNNLAAAVFSGIGTSILFQDNCLPKLLKFLYSFLKLSEDGIGETVCNILIVIILFVLLYFVGFKVNTHVRRKSDPNKKKKTSEGRSEFAEKFHKSIINDIVIGLSFVDKAEELDYRGDVSQMYLYEAAYYFIQAKIQMEEMELLSPEKNKNQDQFIKEIGLNTIKSTCMVFNSGLSKLFHNIPEGTEKRLIKDVIDSIKPYI